MTAQRRVLFLSLTDDVGANRVVGAMAAAGMTCAVMSPPGFLTARSGLIARHFALPQQRGLWLAMPAVKRALEDVLQRWAPDWIVPLDDMASWQLRSLVSNGLASPELRALIIRSLGPERGYAAAVSRSDLLTLAAAQGIRVPANVAARTVDDALAAAETIGFPLMLKLEHTCGGAGVQRIETPDALGAAMIAAGLGRQRSLKKLRTAAKLQIWSQAGLTGLDAAPASVQAHVSGQLAIRTVAAVEGRVLAGVNFLAVAVHPEPTGASTALKPIDHLEMEAAAAKMVAALGASGFLSFDFLLSPDNSAWLIELNARPVGSAHLGARFGHDVCGAMAAYIADRPVPIETQARAPDVEVALFPKELERDPASPRLAAGSRCIHDVPWEDAPVIAAYVERLAQMHPSRMPEIHHALRQPGNLGPAIEAMREAGLTASQPNLRGL